MKTKIELSEKVMALYLKMSEESVLFQKKTQTGCIAGCGKCCKNPQVVASPLEMLPLALEVLKDPNKEEIVSSLDSPSCAFFRSLGGDNGSCGEYKHRPVVCRLFGWSKVNSKTGKSLSVCEAIKKGGNPPSPDFTVSAPDIAQWAAQVRELEPYLGDTLYPINKALKVMIERIELLDSLEG